MVDLYKAADPLAELRHLMTTFWSFAKHQTSEKFGFMPNYFHTIIESDLLLEGDINLSQFNPKEDEEVFERLMEKLDSLLQSQKMKGIENFLEAPFVVDINVINIKNNKKRQQMEGRGRKRKAKLPHVDGIYSGALMDHPFSDIDNLCLFRSINLLVQKHLKNYAKIFYDYKQRAPHQQKIGILRMLNWCGIDPELREYSILDFGDKIQDYLTEHWPGKFKIFAFSTGQEGCRPVFRSKDVSTYEKELVVYFMEDAEEPHYVPVNNAGRLFQDDCQYCYTCEVPYKRASTHRMRCRAKCVLCQRVGPGFPCKEEPDVFIRCDQCNKVFKNLACHSHHVRRYRPGIKTICQRSKMCKDCGCVYDLSIQPKGGHVCGRTYCHFCGYYHAKSGFCKMRYRPKSETPKRFIMYDFECRTDIRPHPNAARFLHQVNFCWAYVCCSECIDKGIWNRRFNKNEVCRICGPHRSYCWSSFTLPDHLQADVHIPVPEEENLVPAFVNWLLHFEQKKMSYVNDPEELPILQEEDPEELHPGIDEEDELRWEMGLWIRRESRSLLGGPW